MEAAQRGLPWMPARVWGGSDIGPFHPGEPLPSDANGGPIWRIPAADIDWALVHVPYSSPRGDLAIGGQAYDVMMVQASRRVIATAERIVPLSELQATWNGRIAPHYDCDFVVECRYGAHPTACYPFYVRDVPHLIEYFETAETDLSAYLQRWLADDEEAYRASHGVDRLLDLERRNAVASLCAAAYAGMSA
jgi:glutaconate CoA-transferase subunit A